MKNIQIKCTIKGKWPEYKKNLIWDKEDYLFTVFSNYRNDSKIFLFRGFWLSTWSLRI